MLHDLIGSPTARLTEPLPRVEIPDDLGVLHFPSTGAEPLNKPSGRS